MKLNFHFTLRFLICSSLHIDRYLLIHCVNYCIKYFNSLGFQLGRLTPAAGENLRRKTVTFLIYLVILMY